MIIFKPIAISLSPNTETDDVKLAWKLFLQVLIKQKSNLSMSDVDRLEREFKKYLGMKYAFSFNSGRSALLAILRSLDIQEGDEVFLQGFTCAVVVNKILRFKAKPIFVDIDETLNLDPIVLEKKISESKKPKAVIIQHTFGATAKIEKIKNICQKHNLFLIEDCAHSLGAKYKGKPCGTFGDAAFFSFGRDKVISSVYGGMAVTNNDKIEEKLKNFQNSLEFSSKRWTIQQLLHPIIFSFALPLYSFFNIGKAKLFLCQKLKILSPSVYSEEKKGEIPEYFPKKMSEPLTALALNQFNKLERFNRHRRKIADIYRSGLARIPKENLLFPTGQVSTRINAEEDNESIYMRYPIFVKNASEIRQKLKKQNILLDDGWHSQVIVPPDADLEKMKYQKGSCPKAEEVVKTILNLPTSINISGKDAKRIVNAILKFAKF